MTNQPLDPAALAELVRLAECQNSLADPVTKMAARRRMQRVLLDDPGVALSLLKRLQAAEAEVQAKDAEINQLSRELQALRAERGYHCNPLFPGDPSMCFGDEQTCRCLNEDEQSKAARAAGG